jgi:hypothetical protein
MAQQAGRLENDAGGIGMKTLTDAQCRKEIGDRVARLRIDSQQRWGKMSAHQMVCHLADSFRGVMGEKSLAARPTFGHGAIKWIALYAPFQWPHGVKTMPEVDQEIGGTRPAEFETDKRDLLRLFERFTREPKDFAWKPHPMFLEMSEKDWMRWGYLHMDHHLRQFGV